MGGDRGSDPSALYDLITSHRVTAVIYVATRFGIADILADGPKPADQLARRTGAHPDSLRRLLRGLVAVGICRETPKQEFELTALGRHLASDAKPSLKAWALFEGELLWRSWGGLLESVRTGRTATGLEAGSEMGSDDRFRNLAQNPQAAKTFDEAMIALTDTISPSVVAAYDFSAIKKLVDVGGGYGQLLIAILKAYPSLRGAVFDLPHCADGARRRIVQASLDDRCEFIPGDFFESVPNGSGALILKGVINSFDDGRSLKILGNCRAALPASGTLLLVERIMPDVPEPKAEHLAVILSDINMLRGPGGRERTENEHRELLRKSGFNLNRLLPAGIDSSLQGASP